jgi:hypothetical protein
LFAALADIDFGSSLAVLLLLSMILSVILGAFRQEHLFGVAWAV